MKISRSKGKTFFFSFQPNVVFEQTELSSNISTAHCSLLFDTRVGLICNHGKEYNVSGVRERSTTLNRFLHMRMPQTQKALVELCRRSRDTAEAAFTQNANFVCGQKKQSFSSCGYCMKD